MAAANSLRLLFWALALACAFASDLNSTLTSSSSSSGSSFADTEVIVPRVGPTTSQTSDKRSIPLPKIITLAVLGCLGVVVVVALLVTMRKYRMGALVNRYESDLEEYESVTPTTNRPHHDYC